MTNKEWLFNLEDGQLAPMLISSENIDEGDYNDDDEWEPWINTYYTSPSGYSDCDYDEVYRETKKWLNKIHNVYDE
jgi:hypothetical protein